MSVNYFHTYIGTKNSRNQIPQMNRGFNKDLVHIAQEYWNF